MLMHASLSSAPVYVCLNGIPFGRQPWNPRRSAQLVDLAAFKRTYGSSHHAVGCWAWLGRSVDHQGFYRAQLAGHLQKLIAMDTTAARIGLLHTIKRNRRIVFWNADIIATSWHGWTTPNGPQARKDLHSHNLSSKSDILDRMNVLAHSCIFSSVEW